MTNIQIFDDTARALEHIARQRNISVWDLIDEISEEAFGVDFRREFEKPRKPEAFYTGGGIWLSAMYGESGNTYFVVDNEDDLCLTCYDHTGEDQEDPFPCQNMVWSVEKKDLSKFQLQTYYKPLLAALKKETEV